MKKYRRTKTKYMTACLFAPWLCQGINAQSEALSPPDSVITVGYARGSLKNISGSVEQITEQQMNKEHNKYEATLCRLLPELQAGISFSYGKFNRYLPY